LIARCPQATRLTTKRAEKYGPDAPPLSWTLRVAAAAVDDAGTDTGICTARMATNVVTDRIRHPRAVLDRTTVIRTTVIAAPSSPQHSKT